MRIKRKILRIPLFPLQEGEFIMFIGNVHEIYLRIAFLPLKCRKYLKDRKRVNFVKLATCYLSHHKRITVIMF